MNIPNFFVASTILLLLLIGCVSKYNESDNNEAYTPYKVYVANSTTTWVYIIDGNERVLIDSLEVAQSPWRMQYVDTLKTLFVNSSNTMLSAIDITLDTLLWKKSFGHGNEFAVSLDGEYLLMVSNWSNINAIFLYSYPEFVLLDSINIKCAFVIEHPDKSLFYIGALSKNDIYIYNCYSLSITDTLNVSFNNQYLGASRSFSITPNGKKLYTTTTGNYLVGIDLVINEVVSVHGIHTYMADIAIAPDGERLYITDPGTFESQGMGIGIYDVTNDEPTGTIYTTDVAWGPDFIDISPDGKYAWVTPTANGWGSGPVMVIDLEKEVLVDTIWVGKRTSVIPSGVAIVQVN